MVRIERENGNATRKSMYLNIYLFILLYLRRVCKDGQDREGRMGMLLGSLYAGMAFANSPCAAVHALAYPIGKLLLRR